MQEVGWEATTEEIRAIARRLRAVLETRYGSLVKAILLYGSYARGTATEDSDVDFLVVVDDTLDPWEVHGSLDVPLFEILLESGQLVSVIVIPESCYEGHRSPFLANVRREGIRV